MDGIMMMESLSQAPWAVVGRTYGNTHATLTGFLVQWWVGLSPKLNWALDGGITLGKGKKKSGGGTAQCDAVLCLRGEPVGVVKVDGTKHLAAVEKLENVLATDRDELRALRFAFLVLHAYEPSGRGEQRAIPRADTPEVLERVAAVSGRFPDKPIVVLAIRREYHRSSEGVRSLSESFQSSVTDVEGILFLGGAELMRRPYDLSILELEPVL